LLRPPAFGFACAWHGLQGPGMEQVQIMIKLNIKISGNIFTDLGKLNLLLVF